MKLAALLLLLFQLAPQGEKASIEGSVLRSGTGEPLSRAELKLTRVMSPDDRPDYIVFERDGQSDGLPSVQTERDGKFVLKNLEPGQYRLVAYRNGYANAAYGSKSPNGQGTIINLAAGEKLTNIVFRMTPAGVISGRVRDDANEPAAGFNVTLLKAANNGERQYLNQKESATTDDRGEYRFFWIPAGRYYVLVSRPRQDFYPGARRVVTDQTIPSAFYPGVADASSASVIELSPGAEVGGVDIVLLKASGNRIRGRLIDGATGKPPESANVEIGPKKEELIEYYDETQRTQYNSKTGEFEVRNVMPGSYWLSASAQPKSDAPLTQEQLADVRTRNDLFQQMYSPSSSAQISIDMSSSDIDGVVLTLKRGSPVPVHVGVEGAELSSLKGADDIRVTLEPEGSGFYRQSGRLDANGNGRVDNVSPARYRVAASFPPSANVYLKDVLYGRADAIRTPIEITEETPSTITVMLSTKGGQIDGRLTDTLSKPVSGNTVVLIPDDRERMRLVRTAISDRDGNFSIRNVAPGEYKLFSWESLEDGEYYSKQVLAKYEAQGQGVRVQESSKELVNVKMIPAPQQ